MNWLAVALVIFLTALVTMLGTAWLTGRQPRIPLDRLADPAPLPGELPRAGRLEVGYLPGPPFAGATRDGYDQLDTGPLLILSEKAAANAALEREIPRLCDEAEAKIPPRWR